MNFFAHATVALWRSDDPRFLLGAMLPDLTNMLGVRLRGVSEPVIAAGVAFHHDTDAAFHAAPLFLALCAQGHDELGAAGVGRGTARAVAHVGVELLLDGTLSHDPAPRSAYRNALEAAAQAHWAEQLELESAENQQRMTDALRQLAGASIPESYRDPGFVAARLRTILARRPRLAMQPSDLPAVQAFLLGVRDVVVRDHALLLEQVRAALPASV